MLKNMARWGAGLLCLTLVSCGVERLEKRIEGLEGSVRDLHRELQLTWANALCSGDVQQLIERVSQSCAAAAEAERNTRFEGVCRESDIGRHLLDADPRGQGRFLSLMNSQRHSVFYIAPGQNSLVPRRVEKLKTRLLPQRRLPTTKFLIASNSASNPLVGRDKGKGKGKAAPPNPEKANPEKAMEEGARRIELVNNLLLELGIPKSLILRWLFSFPIDNAEFQREDDKTAIGETDDPYSGVWVFRVDCAEPPLLTPVTPDGP